MHTISIRTEDIELKELLSLYLAEVSEFELVDDGEILLLEGSPSLIAKFVAEGKLVVSMNAAASTENVIKSIRAGACDFLQKPVIKEQFFNALERIKSKKEGLIPNSSKVISVFSNKGGIGKTSLATNLAVELAEITKEKVALIDLNLQLGDVTTFLDLSPSVDISYFVENVDKLDETFLLSMLEQYEYSELYVLSQPSSFYKSKDITVEQINKLIEVFRKTFSYIIVDTSSIFDEKTFTILDLSDLILFPTMVNIPAIRNCQKCLNLFNNLEYDPQKIKVILNRYMENDEIKAEDVEMAIKKQIYWKIPNNYFTLMSAINKGVVVSKINQEANISQSYRNLALHLAEEIFKQDYMKVSKNSFSEFQKRRG